MSNSLRSSSSNVSYPNYFEPSLIDEPSQPSYRNRSSRETSNPNLARLKTQERMSLVNKHTSNSFKQPKNGESNSAKRFVSGDRTKVGTTEDLE